MWEAIQKFFATILALFLGLFGINQPQAFANVAYSTVSVAQKMDVYIPKDAKGATNVVLFIHGGGWVGGDKDNYTSAAKEMARQGYVAATMNYRMLEQGSATDFRDMLDDIDSAIVKLDAFLREKSVIPQKLAISGASAGGHLTMLYGFTHYESCKIPIAFLAPDVGPSDFTDLDYIDMLGADAILPLISALAGEVVTAADVKNGADVLKEMSPVHQVKSGIPPTILRYGGQDELVPLSNGSSVKAALDAAGVPNDYFVYTNSGHGLSNTANKPGTDYAVNQAYQAKLQEYLRLYFPQAVTL